MSSCGAMSNNVGVSGTTSVLIAFTDFLVGSVVTSWFVPKKLLILSIDFCSSIGSFLIPKGFSSDIRLST